MLLYRLLNLIKVGFNLIELGSGINDQALQTQFFLDSSFEYQLPLQSRQLLAQQIPLFFQSRYPFLSARSRYLGVVYLGRIAAWFSFSVGMLFGRREFTLSVMLEQRADEISIFAFPSRV